jgi:hypothetical protein
MMRDYNDQNWQQEEDPNNLMLGIICAVIISLPIWLLAWSFA